MRDYEGYFISFHFISFHFISFHSSRHGFATLALSKGVPIETISKMLGHTNLTTTQLYAKVTPKKLFDDMDIFIKATSDMTLVL